MVSLKQIRTLQDRVNKALSFIDLLKEENKALKATLDKSQQRIQEFEKLITEFKNDQTEIEQTILDVIHKLDTLEDEVSAPSDSAEDNFEESGHNDASESNSEIETTGDTQEFDPAYQEDQISEEEPEPTEDEGLDETASADESKRDLDIF